MSDLQQSLRNAISFLQAGDFSRACMLLQPLARKSPNNPDVWQLLAASLKGNGDRESARKAFERSLKINPRQPAVLNNLGNLLRDLGELGEAERNYRKAISLNPRYPEALCNLGIVLTDLDRAEESVKILEKALSMNYQHVPTLFALGDACRELDDNESALAWYDRVLAIMPNHYRAVHNRALVLKLMGEYEQAIEGFERALSMQPGIVECIHNLAATHALLGNHDAAEKYYRQCVELEPRETEHHHWLNLFLWAAGSEDFLASHTSELRIRPNNPPLWVDFARKLCQAGRPADARDALQQALKECSDQPVLLRELSAVKRDLRDPEGVVALARRAVDLDPGDTAAKEELGRAYLAEGEYAHALDTFERLLEVDALNQGWWCMKATALRALGDERYGELYDYSRFVAPLPIEVPPGYRSMREFLEALIADIRKYHTTKAHPLDQTLRTGTQSLENLFSRRDRTIRLYKEAVTEQLSAFLSTLRRDERHPLLNRLSGGFEFTDSWSVILKNTGFHRNHFHSAGWFSSAVYLQVPPEVGRTGDGSGWIKFGEPELFLPDKPGPDYVVRPEPGLLVVFPSYMWHGTIPFESEVERITAPFDIVPA